MTAPTAEEVRERLAAIRAARGFVLPHHGLMAAALPELHGCYEAMYRALTLDPRHLAPLARESVWLAILAACAEPVGTHHLAKFRAAGGTDAQAMALFRLAAWSAGASRYAVLDGAWGKHFPAAPIRAAYLAGARALLADGALDELLGRICLAAIHTACDQRWGLEAEIEAALAAGVAEAELAEALSLTIWPRGVNPFVRAAEAWLGLIRAGRVPASDAFLAWADTPDQGALRLPPGG
jgi:alkylhydroperoxidase/carboxymuconolactone decarboxylase family protein YurZ